MPSLYSSHSRQERAGGWISAYCSFKVFENIKSVLAVEMCNRSTINMLWIVLPRCVANGTYKGQDFPKTPVCAAWWELAGQLSPSFYFPLTSIFLSTYLWPPYTMQTLISTSCALAQRNDLPKATWQAMNSPGLPPASCSLQIRRPSAVQGSEW